MHRCITHISTHQMPASASRTEAANRLDLVFPACAILPRPNLAPNTVARAYSRLVDEAVRAERAAFGRGGAATSSAHGVHARAQLPSRNLPVEVPPATVMREHAHKPLR